MRRAAHAKLRRAALVAEQELKLQNELMGSIHTRLFGQPAYLPGGGSPIHGGISFTDGAPPMDPGMLRSAKPLDREFLDMMIAVERRAGALARSEVARGSSADLMAFAADIAHRADVRAARFNDWRRVWYGAASPAMSSADPMAGMSMP